MWHEARRQEKKIRRVIVDYRKRSERRHLYYERIKQDPTKFMQVHGRKSKIHLDGTVATEADNNNHMMPWQGDKSNMIDRFDVRTHLDFYRYTPKSTDDEQITEEERKCNFERYRVLIWNEYKKIPESQHLRQIYIDEQFPEIAAQQKQKQDAGARKMMLAQSKASIGYDYEGGSASIGKSYSDISSVRGKVGDDDGSDEDLEDDLDFLKELEEIPSLSEINMDEITALDDIGVKKYQLRRGGFGDSLLDDQDDIDKIDEAKALESEKQKFSGRKSRRERRLLKDERLRGREIGKLSFVRESSGSDKDSESDSSSGESSCDSNDGQSYQKSNHSKIEYITSFGNLGSSSVKNTHKEKSSSTARNSNKKNVNRSKSRSLSSERYRSSKYRKSRSRSRSRSRSDRYSSSYYRRSRSRGRRSRSLERRLRSPDSKFKSNVAKVMINSTSSSKKSSLEPLKYESKASALKKLTPQEKLKIKMQRALNKQLKSDRNADMEKRLQKQQEQMEREDDLREMAKRMRKRDRGDDDMRDYSTLPYY